MRYEDHSVWRALVGAAIQGYVYYQSRQNRTELKIPAIGGRNSATGRPECRRFDKPDPGVLQFLTRVSN